MSGNNGEWTDGRLTRVEDRLDDLEAKTLARLDSIDKGQAELRKWFGGVVEDLRAFVGEQIAAIKPGAKRR